MVSSLDIPPVVLTAEQVEAKVAAACSVENYRRRRVLLIVPDGTRTAPVGLLFQALFRRVGGVTRAFDVLIALGTHQPMSEEGICRRLEITGAERREQYRGVRFFNHNWNDPAALRQQLGLFSAPPLAAAPKKVAKGKVITSVVAALNNLRGRGHHGPFVVIVATDLNEEAWTPTAPGLVQAPIYAVLPELRSPEDGWIWSDVVPSREGVALSLGGETFDFIVSYDPHIESALVTNTFDIEAALQFRLRINDPTAIESLA